MTTRPEPLEDPFVDMPAMPSPTRRGSATTISRPPVNPFGLSAPLLQLQPPSPDMAQPPELLPPPVIHANTSPSSSRPDSPSGTIPLWTPDSPSAAHPGLPPPPSYDSPLSRARTRSNEDPTAPSSFASPFADSHSLHSLSSDGSGSPPRRADDRKFGSGKARGFVILNGSTPSFLEAGATKAPAMASEDAAARRRRNQKLKWGGLAGGACLVLVLLVALAVGVSLGLVNAA